MAENKKKNQKLNQPFFTSAKKRVIQRHQFINGQLKTYYTPGQNPDVGEPGFYVPPSSFWQPANRILYRPQTVWLYISKLFQGSYTHRVDFIGDGPVQTNIPNRFNQDPQIWHMHYYGDSSIACVAYIQIGAGAGNDHNQPFQMSLGSWVPIPSLDFSGHKVYYFNQGNVGLPTVQGPGVHTSYDFHIDDPYGPEYSRVIEILNGVNDILTKLRPNRTFVQLIDPWNYIGGSTPKFFSGKPHLYWPLMCPSDPNDFFGVNFFCLHFGGCDTTEQIIFDASPDSQGGSLDEITFAKNNSLAIIGNSTNKFCNYAQRYFGYDFDIPVIPHYVYASSIPPDFTILVRPDDPGNAANVHMYSSRDRAIVAPEVTTGFWVPTDANTGDLTSDAGFSDSTVNLQKAIDDHVDLNNKLNHQYGPANIAQLKQDSLDFRSIGIDCLYITETNSISVDFIVSLIAQYYRFNPKNGSDL